MRDAMKKTNPFETILYSSAGIVAMALLLIAVNMVAAKAKKRVDLTREKAYTLSPGTKAILRRLDTPVTIRFYCSRSEGATPETVFLNGYAKRVEDLLAEYKQVAGSKLKVMRLSPAPDSDAEDSARLDGIEGQQLSNGERFYLGLAVNILNEKQAIPFLAPNREKLLEYDISRAISRVFTTDKPVVGIMSALPVFGQPANPMMARMGQPQQGQEPWVLVNELKNDYTVKRVDPNAEKIDDDIKVLLAIHPRDITDVGQFALDQFIMRGGKLIAFLDALPIIDTKEQNQMMENIPNSGSNLDKLLKAWGLSFDTSKVVADMNFKMQLQGRDGQPQDAPAFLSITAEGINKEDVITSEIDNIWLPFAGAFSGTPVGTLKETVLLHSSKDSQLVDGFMANLSGENVMKEFKSSGKTYPLAVRLFGSFKTAFPEGRPEDKKADEKKDDPTKKPEEKTAAKKADNSLKATTQDNTVILVGDADMLFDNFSIRQMQSPFGTIPMVMNGNLNFAQNAVDQLGGDNNLISVRSRATQNHPFTLVKKMQAEAESSYRARIKELEDSLAETQKRVNELQQNKEKGQRFILSPEQQKELENFRSKEASVKSDLKQERKKLRTDIERLETRTKALNIAAVPLLVSLTGIGLALFKRKRTAAK